MNSHFSMQVGSKTFPCSLGYRVFNNFTQYMDPIERSELLKTLLFGVLLMEGTGILSTFDFLCNCHFILVCETKQITYVIA